MDTSELRGLAERLTAKDMYGSDDEFRHEECVDALKQAADEIDRLRCECREEHELYQIRAEERDEVRAECESLRADIERGLKPTLAETIRARDEARAEATKYHDLLLLEQLKTPEARELDIANGATDATADKLRAIAETGVHRGVFGGEKVEAAAQAILRIRAQLARAVEVLRYYSDELLYYEPDAPIDGGQSARDLLRDLTVNSIPETLKPE